MKKAIYYKKHHYIEYFNSRNTTVCKECRTLKQAKAIVLSSGIDQELISK